MKLENATYVEKAEKVIQDLIRDAGNVRDPLLTTSKIRNILSMTSDIYNDVLTCKEETLGADIQNRISYLKVRIVYESGREDKVKRFVEKAELLACINEIKGKRSQYLLFSRYMEALVAYHRYYGGKD